MNGLRKRNLYGVKLQDVKWHDALKYNFSQALPFRLFTDLFHYGCKIVYLHLKLSFSKQTFPSFLPPLLRKLKATLQSCNVCKVHVLFPVANLSHLRLISPSKTKFVSLNILYPNNSYFLHHLTVFPFFNPLIWANYLK